MSSRTRLAAALLAAPLIFAGCATSASHSPNAHQQMTPGMVMPDGSTMGPTTMGASTMGAMSPAGDVASQPSEAAKMICSAETSETLATVLQLPAKPVGTPSWHAPHYTCTYSLPMGTFVLSVHQGSSPADGAAYLDTLRRRLHATPEIGLTPQAYGTTDGQVILLKDNDVLHVDASALPAEFGDLHTQRVSFAYQIATDILGCWTGDEHS